MRRHPQYRVTPILSAKARTIAASIAGRHKTFNREETLNGLTIIVTLLNPEFTQKGLRLPHANYEADTQREAVKLLEVIIRQAKDEKIVAEDGTIRAGCDLYLVIDALMDCEENGADEYTRAWGEKAIEAIGDMMEKTMRDKDENLETEPATQGHHRQPAGRNTYHNCRYRH